MLIVKTVVLSNKDDALVMKVSFFAERYEGNKYKARSALFLQANRLKMQICGRSVAKGRKENLYKQIIYQSTSSFVQNRFICANFVR